MLALVSLYVKHIIFIVLITENVGLDEGKCTSGIISKTCGVVVRLSRDFHWEQDRLTGLAWVRDVRQI